MLRLAVVSPGDQCDRYQSAAQRSLQFYLSHVVDGPASGGAHVVPDVSTLLAMPDDFDACVLHANVTDAAAVLRTLAGGGKPVLLHPLTLPTVAELQDVAHASRTAGGVLCLATPSLFTPYAQVILNDLQAGRLGRPGLIRIHRWESQSSATPESLAWNLAREIELVCAVYDAAPQRLFGRAMMGKSGVRGWSLHLEFSAGMAIIDSAAHAGPPYYTVSVIGSSGAAYADDHRNSQLLFNGSTQAICATPDDDGLRHQLETFVKQLKSEAVEDNSVANLARAVSVCRAITDQAGTGGLMATRKGDQYELQ